MRRMEFQAFSRKPWKHWRKARFSQGKKKHKVKIAIARSATSHPSQLDIPPTKVLGEKRGHKQLELHHSFESLGILLLERAKQCKVRIWLVLTKEKGSLVEILVHSKNKTLPSLPIGIRVEGEGEEDWSSQSAMEKLIKHVAASLEDNVLRHQLPMEEALNLEWSWRE
jgi:hypothetical protein